MRGARYTLSTGRPVTTEYVNGRAVHTEGEGHDTARLTVDAAFDPTEYVNGRDITVADKDGLITFLTVDPAASNKDAAAYLRALGEAVIAAASVLDRIEAAGNAWAPGDPRVIDHPDGSATYGPYAGVSDTEYAERQIDSRNIGLPGGVA